jgi:hypothetical protein
MAEQLTPPQTRVEQSWRLFWVGLLRDNRRRTILARRYSTGISHVGRRR